MPSQPSERPSPLPTLSRSAVLALLVAWGGGACGGGGSGNDDPTGPTTGTLSGSVTASGAGVPGAALTLQRAGAAPLQASSAANGSYSFSNLTPGNYTVTISPPPGFDVLVGESHTRSASVTAGQTTTVDFTLRVLNGGGGGTPVTVNLTAALAFDPPTLTIQRGTTVRWVNQGGGFHTVTPQGHTQWPRAELPSTGNSFQHTFNTPGTFPYFCEPHAGMSGTITVQ